MTLSDQPVRLQFQSASPRGGDEGGGWSEGVAGPEVLFDAATATIVSASSGSTVRWIPNNTLLFTYGRLDVWQLDASDRPVEHGSYASVQLGGDAAGLDVPMPLDADRWLVRLYGQWQTDCINGDGYVDLLLITT
jgi:hypothetical protein